MSRHLGIDSVQAQTSKSLADPNFASEVGGGGGGENGRGENVRGSGVCECGWSSPSDIFDKEAIRALKEWQYNATGQEHKALLVQLDFELDVVPPEMERISVKAATADHG